ncbi:peroxisomal testis-specific protein 1 [Octodon degus]|uniref:Peroxisomal testis-specific protein 1 n=1 Tax=Octodon degus TaxID=10160 RepID=A0A6P6F2D7_OCTDE|nr:peroxisomal testis-specific protein 1 [Octodon degus]
MTRLVSLGTPAAMALSPARSPPSQPKEDHTDRNREQGEALQKLAMQLRRVGDSIEHRTVEEQGLGQEDRGVPARFTLFVFGRAQALLGFLLNNRPR